MVRDEGKLPDDSLYVPIKDVYEGFAHEALPGTYALQTFVIFSTNFTPFRHRWCYDL